VPARLLEPPDFQLSTFNSRRDRLGPVEREIKMAAAVVDAGADFAGG